MDVGVVIDHDVPFLVGHKAVTSFKSWNKLYRRLSVWSSFKAI